MNEPVNLRRYVVSWVTPVHGAREPVHRRRDRLMEQCSTVIGLDVHKETISVAILPPGAERVVDTMKIPNTSTALEQLVRRLVPRGPLAFVYEAGPCG